MKSLKTILLLMLLLALFLPTQQAYAKENFDDQVVFGGTFTLESGDSLDGNLVVIGGAATMETASTLNGDLVLIGGTVDTDGTVNGTLVGIGGAVTLNENALVNGDLVTMGASLTRADGSRINGQVVTGISVPFSFNVPEDGPTAPGEVVVPEVVVAQSNPLLDFIWFIFRTFMWAALAVLLVMFMYKPTSRVVRAATEQPIVTAGAGLVTAVLTPLALIALIVTLILIPVALVVVLVLVAAWFFGWIALGLEVGNRLAKLVNINLAPAIAAGIGTFLLRLVFGSMETLVQCVGWIPGMLIGLWALGAVILTRFGSQDYPEEQVLDAAMFPGSADEPEVITVITEKAEAPPSGETSRDDPDELPPAE